MVKGMFLYQDKHTTSQVSNIREFFEKLLIEEKFDTVIEIGTAYAGLTYILDDIRTDNKLNCKIETFDNAEFHFVKDQLEPRGIPYNIMDERTEDFKDLVINMISNGGKTLVLCDGGNKINEFNFYSDYLKNNDMIMAHDYAESSEFFLENINEKIWNWMEITYDDIKESVSVNNLVKYDKINFDHAVWCCFKKI